MFSQSKARCLIRNAQNYCFFNAQFFALTVVICSDPHFFLIQQYWLVQLVRSALIFLPKVSCLSLQLAQQAQIFNFPHHLLLQCFQACFRYLPSLSFYFVNGQNNHHSINFIFHFFHFEILLNEQLSFHLMTKSPRLKKLN